MLIETHRDDKFEILHVSVCDHHQGARTWAWLKLQLLKMFGKNTSLWTCSGVAAATPLHGF